jgi:hypothetical protein
MTTEEKVSKILRNRCARGDNRTQKCWMATHTWQPPRSIQFATMKQQPTCLPSLNKCTQPTKMATEMLPKCDYNGGS